MTKAGKYQKKINLQTSRPRLTTLFAKLCDFASRTAVLLFGECRLANAKDLAIGATRRQSHLLREILVNPS